MIWRVKVTTENVNDVTSAARECREWAETLREECSQYPLEVWLPDGSKLGFLEDPSEVTPWIDAMESDVADYWSKEVA